MRSIVLTAIALMIVAFAAPQFLASPTDERPKASAGGNAAQPAPRRGDVEIHAETNGHFYVDLKVEGRKIEAMVDTGASVVALRESDARRAGIRVRRGDFKIPMSTANGTAYAAAITLRSVAVDNVEIRNVSAVVMPDDKLAITLLGASFLNELRRFEVSDRVLVLEN
nr:MAG: TIGR02281 family clan AA aspartic protease [Hyphomicrobiales bacterium]